MHFLLPGCVQAVWQSLLSVLSGQEYVATSAGRISVGCCVNDKHTAQKSLRAIHTKTPQTEVNEKEFLRHCARASPRKCRASAAQGPNPGQRNIGQPPCTEEVHIQQWRRHTIFVFHKRGFSKMLGVLWAFFQAFRQFVRCLCSVAAGSNVFKAFEAGH